MVDNTSSNKLCLQWNKVLRRFTDSFESVYCASKKAHFDCLPQSHKVVDGAKIKWCNLLLLDAIIYFSNAEEFNFLSRRAFNQQRELFEALLGTSEITNHMGYSIPLTHINVENTIIQVNALSFPWDSIENLRLYLLRDPPSKSKYKYISSVELLCSHPSLTTESLSGVFMNVVKVAIKSIGQFQHQMMVQIPRPTFKLPDDKMASMKHVTLPKVEISTVSSFKRSFSFDCTSSYSKPPNFKRQAIGPRNAIMSVSSNSHSLSMNESSTQDSDLNEQFFENVFIDLEKSFQSSHSISSVKSDVTTTTLSDETSFYLHSFDSMDSFDSSDIALMNGY